MVIDIIDYTEAQFAALKRESLEKVRDAQTKKNKLWADLQTRILAEKQRLIDRRVFASNIWEKKKAELEAVYEVEVEGIREGLLFYLRYSGASEDTIPEDVPYPVDYALSEAERMNEVRSYYLTTYQDAQARFDAFAADSFARTYLGELYAPLYHYFENMI